MDKSKALYEMLEGNTVVDSDGNRYMWQDNMVFSELDVESGMKPINFNVVPSNWKFKLESERVFDIKPFDQILVRNTSKGRWHPRLFAHRSNEPMGKTFACLSESCWNEIVLYKGNEDKLNTTEPIKGSWTREDYENVNKS